MVPTIIHSRIIEQAVLAINNHEPVLLVGETGTGKTSCIQYIAARTGNNLRVVNMSRQSQASDLIGSFRPVDASAIMRPVFAQFHQLMTSTYPKNDTVLSQMAFAFKKKQFEDVLLPMMKHVTTKATLDGDISPSFKKSWNRFGVMLQDADIRIRNKQISFAFVEGELVQAVRNGDWLLFDEINLAPAELLESISGLLDSGSLSIADISEPVITHPNFRIFGSMNPANDYAKKDLPDSLRNRFTELYVPEANSEQDISQIVVHYLPGLRDKPAVRNNLVKFYLKIRNEKSIRDMSGKGTTFSLRTLSRCLQSARDVFGATPSGIYQALQLSFVSGLDDSSTKLVEGMIEKYKFKNKTKISQPDPGVPHVTIKSYHIYRGDETELVVDDKFIITDTVDQNLRNLSRAISARNYPILIQGETSTGKTSLISFLAKASGNKLIRINNHEHTDLQEYVGSYIPKSDGSLVFSHGALVKAMRNGWWLLLDELNLAPADVLEALNRVLDDNRELFIPETGEVIKAHPRFQLFGAQNPAGVYGGRKQLSRAFTNRFVQMEFCELSNDELEVIVSQKCDLPLSKSKLLVEAVSELRKLRRDSDVFGGKNSYATLRDLFRWADRYSKEKDMEYNDWDRHLALDGYFLLGGRCRSKIESENVKKVLERVFRRTLGTDDSIFSGERLEADGINERTKQNELQKIVLSRFYWGEKSRRMAILLDRCLKFNEPILLVGPTGCGKTTIVQLLSPQGLSIMNCHQQTEASDFIGGLRPVRENTGDSKALFKWSDGPLVESMKNGSVLLVDEISLADDSVLERLNSVLERERTLVLAEKGITDVADKDSALDILTATAGFQFIGTMNPGGDYGKKELSPALRNRMTEIWCEPPDSEEEFSRIIQNALKRKTIAEKVSSAIWEFVAILKEDPVVGQQVVFSVRDALAYAEFINEMLERVQNQHTMQEIFVDTCRAVHLDSIGCSGFDLAVDQVATVKNNIEKKLFEMTFKYFGEGAYPETLLFKHPKCLGGLIPVGPGPKEPRYPNFVRTSSVAATTNRIGRAMLLPRPILLEGSPGVGKTSIVASLAAMCGYPVTRINLSEQTDVSDLFGADLPVEGGQGGQFEWKDGPLLIALKHGHWVILDELNLASQPVLEGLNSVFDHRGELFVPELNKTFNISGRGCRFFACQNPRVQGGGRKGLPKSFVNRFTRVYCNELTWQDLVNIVYATGPDVCLPGMRLEHFSEEFRSRFADEIEETPSPRTIGLGKIENAPHYPDPRATRAMLIAIVQANNEACKYLEHSGLRAELNLRDIRRFTDLIGTGIDIAESFKLIYRARIRNMQDDDEINKIYLKWLDFPTLDKPNEQIKDFEEIKPDLVRFGVAQNKIRHARREVTTLPQSVLTLRERSHLEQILLATQHGWMVQLVGEAGVGKSTLVQLAADMTRQRLRLLSLSPATDVTDLLGAFEQYNFEETYENAFDVFRSSVRAVLSEEIELCEESILELMKLLEQQAEPEHTLSRIESLLRHKIPAIPSLYESIGKLKDLLKSEKKSDRGSFRWVDSDLVKAVEQGDWLVLDNANQASDALLDRLNSLLEPDGTLSIIERGNVNGEIVTIRPHPEFRIFILVDPFYGELSRPLRNRGVELFIKPHELSEYLSIGSTLCADQETAKMLYQSLSDSLCHKKFDGIFFSGCRRYNLEMTCGSSENNAFKSALAHCRHLLKRSSVSNTEAMEVILPIVGPAAPASLLESACSLYKPIEWDLAYNVARQYQTKLEETREAAYGERFSFMEIVSREIMCFMNKEEIFTALIGTTDAQNRDEHRENILQRASDWTFDQDLQQCIITIFKYMYENDEVQFDRKHNFISGSLLGALREGGSKARIGLMTPIIRTIMDLFGKRFQFDDEQELISLYFLIISLRRSNTSNQLSVGPYYAKCLLDVLEPYIPRLSGNKYKELRTEVATIRKFSTGEQLITSDVLSKIAYVGPFKTLEEFNETIKLWEMIAIINKDPNKFVATRSLIQLLSVLNHGTPGESTRDIEKISLDQPEKVFGISVHPFLFYLLFNQFGGDDESAIRIPGELLRNLACIGNSIDSVYKPSLASALAYISSTKDMIDYQVKGQFAFKCFADSIFGDLEWKSNRFGLLTLVPIGKYEQFTERYKLTSSRAWKNMRFHPTTALRKIKSEINQILEKLKPLRQMPTIDPVVEANIDQGICQDLSAYYNDVSDALTFVRENTGIVSFCRQTDVDNRRNQLQERLNVLSTKVGERVGHDEYINLRKVIVDFIENTVTPVDDDMQINENLITTCRGFLSILHGFVWYPDIIVPVSDLVTRLIYFSEKYLAKRKSESKHEEYQSLESKDRSLEPIIEASLVRFDQAEIFEHEQLLTTVCNFVNNWTEKKEEIEARKAEEESQFKFKNIDLGQSVEEQLEEEDQEYHEFFQSDSEFKSEAEGPKAAKECELENFAKMVDVFLKKDLSVDSSCKTENKFELMRIFKNPKELATTDSELISRLIKDKHHFDEIDVFVDSDFDVYRRSNPKEAASVCAPLRALGDRVAELETQFDDHPTLVSIRKMAEKVLELPLFAPVISLCTGIEMVLSRVNDWHQNAPKRLSLQAETDSLWNMVVEWRKRELHQWKAILETSINLEAQKSNHLFPEIWRVATQESLENIRLMCTSFLTSANCANFARRISLLRRVAQILRIEMGEQTAVIENICDFYEQFMPNVLKQTNAVKNSIEKELKEFVAIQRWKDINFYARKEAATKIRRQLFKFVKKLKESLVDKTAVDLFKIDHETLRLPVIQNVELLSPQETIPVKYEFEGDVLSQHPKLIPKMNNYSLSVSSSFEQFNKTFTAEITETTLDVKERFDKLASETQSIPSDGDREKRIKIVKSLLTKKRRALFDLFSVAKEAGLSFKRGLNRAKEETIISDWFYVKNSVNSNAKNRIIQKLLDVHSAKKSPDKAVSRNESDRLIGYTFHLASVTKTILQNANRLQSQVQRLERMYKIAETGIFMDLEAHYGVLSAKLTDCIFAIADLQLYLDCAPDEINSHRWDCSPNFPALEKMNKSEISEMKEFLSVLRKTFESLKNQLGSTETDNNVSRANEVNKLISQAEESCHHRAFSQIIKIVDANNHCDNGGIRDMHIFVAAMKTLYQSMKLVQKEIASQTQSSRSHDTIPLNKFFAQTTFAFQNLVKNHSEAKNSDKIFQNQAVLASMLESFIIPEREFADFSSFYSQILGKSEELTIFITKIIHPYINLAKSMLSHFHHMEIYNIALLDQLSTISFLVLSRGFCLPEDIADDVLEQEGEEIGGGGAGGGQAGTDDVTEEFEEDDLDDPLPGDSKADKNDKDQEQGEGIEMDNGMDDADDVEDVEDQDDQDAQEEEDEPLEDEMGDLGDENLADKMDEKVWGDEDDRDEVEESNDNREEDGKGDERDQTQVLFYSFACLINSLYQNLYSGSSRPSDITIYFKELQAKDDGLADGADNEKGEDLPEPPEKTQENEQPSDDENEQDQEGAQDESEFNAEEQAQPPPEDFETEAPDVDDVDFEEKNDGDENEEDAKQDDDGIELDDAPPEGINDIFGIFLNIDIRNE
jgi:midasin (ATPase involved in ribosome maturation)